MVKTLGIALLLLSVACSIQSQQPPVPHAVIESYKDGVVRAHTISVGGIQHTSFTAVCESRIIDAVQAGVREPKECHLGEGFVGQTISYSESTTNQDGKLRFVSSISNSSASEPGLFVLMQEKGGLWRAEFFRQCGNKDLGPLESYCH